MSRMVTFMGGRNGGIHGESIFFVGDPLVGSILRVEIYWVDPFWGVGDPVASTNYMVRPPTKTTMDINNL